MFLLALAMATMPQPIGRTVPSDLTALSIFSAETRPVDFRVRLDVDAAGRPVACDVDHPDDRDRSLARRVCTYLVTTARFAPARDSAGVPMAAVVRVDLSMNRTTTLQAATGQPRQPGKLDYALTVASLPGGAPLAVTDLQLATDAAGRVTACDVAASSGSAALDRIACREMLTTGFPPGVDGAQHPVAALRRVSVGFATGAVAQ